MEGTDDISMLPQLVSFSCTREIYLAGRGGVLREARQRLGDCCKFKADKATEKNCVSAERKGEEERRGEEPTCFSLSSSWGLDT